MQQVIDYQKKSVHNVPRLDTRIRCPARDHVKVELKVEMVTEWHAYPHPTDDDEGYVELVAYRTIPKVLVKITAFDGYKLIDGAKRKLIFE